MKMQDLWGVVRRREYRAYFLLIVVTYAYILLSASFSQPHLFALTGLGIVYALTGPFGEEYCQRHASSWPIVLAYFVEQLTISGVILFLSQGTAFLLLTPLVAFSVVLLPRRGVAPMCGLLLLLLVLVDWSVGQSWRFILLTSLPMLASFAFMIAFTEALHEEARAHAALDEAHQRLREYSAQIETLATLAERNRLAREIHDHVGHYLTTITIQLEAARTVLEENPALTSRSIEKALGLAREGLSQIRSSVASLRTLPTENRSLPEALADLVREAQTEDSVVSLCVPDTLPQLSAQIKFTLYRVAQEGLTNARKHAHADHIELILDCPQVSQVTLRVKDDGVGSLSTTGGFGLLGARERVHALGGQLRTESLPGQGFFLEVELPL
ncbi:two-component sensor histidine kinase [Reticulibacter mediterranei]|uniref:histidine kinase n=1 Tax=Reticulibacter mediterranei TaxID=2778369 RepID=A0A8J3N5J8_9CHLR|nr:sensor histidine kinase [Reticulibacter mediterranei]GHO96460.1 two-component sensor histidine kinase [Reticulibacter mediterranei]